VSLADARQAAEDFLIQRTTRLSLADFLDLFDLGTVPVQLGVAELLAGGLALVVRGVGPATLVLYDRQLHPRLELAIDGSAGYEGRGGLEFPTAGLRVVRVWPPGGAPVEDLRDRGLIVRPRR
jgi:hypothetical protein